MFKCMSQKEKVKYINELNRKYNYDKSVIDFITDEEYKIC